VPEGEPPVFSKAASPTDFSVIATRLVCREAGLAEAVNPLIRCRRGMRRLVPASRPYDNLA